MAKLKFIIQVNICFRFASNSCFAECEMRNTQCTSHAHRAFANTFHANENGNGPWKLEIVRFCVDAAASTAAACYNVALLLLAVLAAVAHKIPVEGEMSFVKLNR